MRYLRCLLCPDGDGGGGGALDASGSPPAAAVVAAGTLSEGNAAELVRLRQEKDELGKLVKSRETRLAELEDENRRLKNPVPPAVVQKRGFLDGLAEYFPTVG